MSRRPSQQRRIATHRPAVRQRRFRHDDLIAVDLFSGFGGLTKGIELAGFTTIMAANHNAYKVEIHEANHPHAEHWIADLVDPEAADYHSARDLPPGDLLVAGVSCVNHSQANTKKAYQQRLSLFDLDDPEFDERVTKSERDRATANCVLHYAAQHHPRMILIECTTELTSWGPAVQGKKYGDGSTYRWWLKQFGTLGYKHRVLYLNSMFFDVPQSRDRGYWIFWDEHLPTPDLDHQPESWCSFCDTLVQAAWTWKTGIPPTGSVRYGKQYEYRCRSCRSVVVPPFAPSLHALDLSNLGSRIGDKPLREFKDKHTGEITRSPLAPATMARAERCRQRFADFPAVLMPAKSQRGSERHPWQPLATQTSQQETSILSTGALIAAAGNTYERPGSECRTRTLGEVLPSQTATNTQALFTPPVALMTGQVMVAHRHNGDGKHITQAMDTVTSTHEKAVLLAVNNFQGAPRGADEPLPTQGGSETMGLLAARVLPNRTNGTSRSVGEPMETLVGGAGSGGLGVLSSGVLPFRKNTTPTSHAQAMPTVTSDQIPGLLTATGTLTARDTTALGAQWREVLANLKLEDCYFRMMASHEVGAGCGFDVDFADRQGTFIVWGSARDQVDGFGNAVSPPVGHWIGNRLRAVLHAEECRA
ncbi:DNA cytosine methyltransferase [Sphaerisporangium sp. TRM90804]|uniref:DNA cytosine methyltransferase n=1 Tax=Sphaerisporangium sp. TRM90804 TaxID=3031113 RepID=UPI00244AB05D|nr:DNA cytosine methyltransferase [Sphaerisporangium sp. TRM90804]MDH2424821.1 DNA cytosine methyltransferase [Sphaerisporangium sp. TRM90804]